MLRDKLDNLDLRTGIMDIMVDPPMVDLQMRDLPVAQSPKPAKHLQAAPELRSHHRAVDKNGTISTTTNTIYPKFGIRGVVSWPSKTTRRRYREGKAEENPSRSGCGPIPVGFRSTFIAKHLLNARTTCPEIVLPLTENPKCRHCTSLTVDQALQEHFKINVCRECRDARPDQYSLLTKTECKEDYLLTESELRDPEALPHWLRPNPHKTTWSNMMLYLREQVEEFAWKKWGSAEALDAEFERREKEKRDKKEKKHKEKMAELRRKTRTSSWVKKEEKHVHKWVVEEDDGSGAKIEICKECGLTIEVEDF